MLLAVDVGNTNTVFGFYDGRKLAASFRIVTDHADTFDECALIIDHFRRLKGISSVKAIVVATVVPKFEPIYLRLAEVYYGYDPLFVNHKVKLNITIDYPKPGEIGADRLCNAAAAHDRFGGPIVVVDFGTATTFDIVSGEGAYLGGIIAPGIESSQAALSHRAAQLFKVSIERPPSAIGKSTEAAMRAGSYLGAVGQTDFIVEKIAAELKDEPKVIATGGLAQMVAPESRYISEVIPDITLDGLRLIYELNQN